jgi:hypothetical protein
VDQQQPILVGEADKLDWLTNEHFGRETPISISYNLVILALKEQRRWQVVVEVDVVDDKIPVRQRQQQRRLEERRPTPARSSSQSPAARAECYFKPPQRRPSIATRSRRTTSLASEVTGIDSIVIWTSGGMNIDGKIRPDTGS